MSELHHCELVELAARLRARELSPVEVTRALLDRIERRDPELRSYATVLADSALAEARRAEQEIADGRHRGPLHGVPVAVKDLCDAKGVPTTAGSPVLTKAEATADSTVVERLRGAGAVLLGKLKLTEGAWATHHPAVAPPINPWHPDRWTGVSSSGSGVATAAGLCFGSLGSDTGGSIRFPSACCGVTGLKPTYGRVSRHGVFPLAESLDHVGPMARSAADAAAVLSAIAGHDPRDPTSLPGQPRDYLAGLDAGVAGLRLGVDDAHNRDGSSDDVVRGVEGALQTLERLGADVRRVRVPPVADAVREWTTLCFAEAVAAHAASFPARADEYGPQLRGLLGTGLKLTGADYARAHAERLRFAGALRGLFESVDVLLCPVTISAPPPLQAMANPDPELVARVTQYTAPYDMSGSPTLTLPCGFDGDGLPLAVQLIGPHLSEATLLRTGHAYQQETDWHRRHPPE